MSDNRSFLATKFDSKRNLIVISSSSDVFPPGWSTSQTSFKSNLFLIHQLFFVPCRLHEVHFKAPMCEAKREEVIFLDGNFSSSAQFFLTVGVFAFLYSLLATIVYVFYQKKYLRNNRGPLVVSESNLLQNIPLMSTPESLFAFVWNVTMIGFLCFLSRIL